MAFAPTHRAPDEGLDAYSAPDPGPGAATQIPGGLDVEIVERRADWAQVRTGNGWEGWVDGRRLVEIPVAPPVATPPPPPTPPAPPVVTPTPEPTPTPTAAWGTPTPPTAPESAGWAAPAATTAPKRGIGPGSIVALIGAAILALTSVLDWLDAGIGENGFKVGAKTLFSVDDLVFDYEGFPQIGVLMLVFAALVVIGAFVKPARILAVVGGGLALIASVLFVVQCARAADKVNDLAPLDYGVADVAGFGAFLAIPASIVAVVGGVLLLAQKR